MPSSPPKPPAGADVVCVPREPTVEWSTRMRLRGQAGTHAQLQMVIQDVLAASPCASTHVAVPVELVKRAIGALGDGAFNRSFDVMTELDAILTRSKT